MFPLTNNGLDQPGLKASELSRRAIKRQRQQRLIQEEEDERLKACKEESERKKKEVPCNGPKAFVRSLGTPKGILGAVWACVDLGLTFEEFQKIRDSAKILHSFRIDEIGFASQSP